MAKIAAFYAVAASGVLFASPREADVIDVLSTNPSAKQEDRVVDVDALAAPILSKLTAEQRMALQVVLARQGGINPKPKPLLADEGKPTVKAKQPPAPKGWATDMQKKKADED